MSAPKHYGHDMATDNQELDYAFAQFGKKSAQAAAQRMPASNRAEQAWTAARRAYIEPTLSAFASNAVQNEGRVLYPGGSDNSVGITLHSLEGISFSGGMDLLFDFDPSTGEVRAMIVAGSLALSEGTVQPAEIDKAFVTDWCMQLLDLFADRAT